MEAHAHSIDIEKWYRLGEMFYTGQRTAHDLIEAKKWFKKAAQYGHADAQRLSQEISEQEITVKQTNAKSWFELGLFYIGGPQPHRDEEEAYKWFEKAAECGHEDAKSFLRQF